MLLKEILEVNDLLDDPHITGNKVAGLYEDISNIDVGVKTIEGEKGSTDFITVSIPQKSNKDDRNDPPTLGIVGRLGGIGARPKQIGAVSDADGAIVALACAKKLSVISERGDFLPGKVIISTHVCPDAPTAPHDPVPFMGSPVDIKTMNEHEISDEMDAVFSIDATKGNKIINQKGFALSPTVKEGYILPVADDLLELMKYVLGSPPRTFPLSMQDITPYGNDLHHINSIMQPSTATDSPVVGVATTSGEAVPGSYTGANYPTHLEKTARFCCEVAKKYGSGKIQMYDPEEFQQIKRLYGSMKKLKTLGKK